MSGLHARIVGKDGALFIEDAGSTNGTIVNGEACASRALSDGDVIELGQTVFLYQEIETAGAPRDLDPYLAGVVGRDDHAPPGLRRTAGAPGESGGFAVVAALARRDRDRQGRLVTRAVHEAVTAAGPVRRDQLRRPPRTLVESELFGYRRGAFSGAVKDDREAWCAAPTAAPCSSTRSASCRADRRSALLRVLQEGEVGPVGSTQAVKVDVRVLAATHQPLEQLVETGPFRRDLYARLAGYAFALEPLRERRMDVGVITAALFNSGKLGDREVRIDREALHALLVYDWPMNVRELEQCLRAALVLAEDGFVTVDALSATVSRAKRGGPPEPPPAGSEDERLQRELVARFAEARGNVSEVARAMGKARQQVQRWAKRFGIDPAAFRN